MPIPLHTLTDVPDTSKNASTDCVDCGRLKPAGHVGASLHKQNFKSTRIKDAGIAIRHSRGMILCYTAGSRNGLEGLDGKGPRPKFMKKGFQIIKKGFVQKFGIPKWVCRSPLAHFEAAPPFFKRPDPIFTIFGRASGQIFETMEV